MFKYSIHLAWSDEDESYIATIPEFPNLSAFGETPEEAVEEAKIAAEGFIKIYKEDDCALPDPRQLSSYSGQTRLRLPKSLHAALSQEAKAEGVSLNTYINHLLSERHMVKKIENKIDRIESIAIGTLWATTKPETDTEKHLTLYKEINIDDFLNKGLD